MVGETAGKLYNLSWILMLAGLIGTVQYFFGGSDPIALLGALMMLIGLVLFLISSSEVRTAEQAEKAAREADTEHSYSLQMRARDPERGGCLSLWLLGQMVFNTVGVISFLFTDTPFDAVTCGVGIAQILSAAALWNWLKWGAYGLATINALSFLIGIAMGDLFVIVFSMVPLTLLYLLVRPIWDSLE